MNKLDRAKELWMDFGDVPMNPETERIEVSWLGFLAGTHREVIWRWFEEYFDVSVAEDLMGCEMDEWFGIVRWCDEDLYNALKESGVDATEENVCRLRHLLGHHSFTDAMIERGWDVIYQTISEFFDRGDVCEEEEDD